jgi:hypothetical protein
MIDNKKIFQVYKNMEQHLHNDEGHVLSVSPASREAVRISMGKTGLNPLQHSEAMLKISDIYRNSANEEEFERLIEALNK